MHMQTIEGYLTDNQEARIAIAVTRFNDVIGKGLLSGALDALTRYGVPDANITIARVPGAYELPLTAKTLAETGRYDAVICLGAVIRGATPHFDYVAGTMASGLTKVALQTGIPVIFGVLTTDTMEQAFDRAGAKSGNKGSDAVITALEMIDLYKKIKSAG
jgi:6,7-dimethyl-8-ribityllumazine synthase